MVKIAYSLLTRLIVGPQLICSDLICAQPLGSAPMSFMGQLRSERSGGAAIGLDFALAEAGMDVLVTYRTSPAAAERTVAKLQALGVEARAFGADLANAEAVPQLADAVLAQAGA
jgi:hypothetical protein